MCIFKPDLEYSRSGLILFKNISTMKKALLISTYNWPEALNLVLKSVMNQTVLPDEILIADDGSTEATKVVIDSFREKINIPVKHIWHEDKGFRKAMILNKAITQCESDYVIQVDGDCILHPKFINDHIKSSSPDTYLYGSRSYIQKKYKNDVLNNEKIKFTIFSPELKSLKLKSFTRDIRFHYLNKLTQKKSPNFSKKVRGCNFSFWLKDLLAINGFNEDFEGWGCEDTDVAIRMTLNKTYAYRLRYEALVYHIWHPESSKENYQAQFDAVKNVIENKIVRCENGIDKYM